MEQSLIKITAKLIVEILWEMDVKTVENDYTDRKSIMM